MIDELDYFRESEITCPYCGWKDRDSWELTDSGEVICENCEKEFYVEREVDVKYTSKPLE
jgi:uncharacterized protein (DUF2225 family)